MSDSEEEIEVRTAFVERLLDQYVKAMVIACPRCAHVSLVLDDARQCWFCLTAWSPPGHVGEHDDDLLDEFDHEEWDCPWCGGFECMTYVTVRGVEGTPAVCLSLQDYSLNVEACFRCGRPTFHEFDPKEPENPICGECMSSIADW